MRATLQGGADMASGDTYSYDLPELADSVRLNVIQRTSGVYARKKTWTLLPCPASR